MSDIKASVRDYVHVRNPMQSPAMVDLEQYKQVVLLEYQKAADAGFPVSDQDIFLSHHQRRDRGTRTR